MRQALLGIVVVSLTVARTRLCLLWLYYGYIQLLEPGVRQALLAHHQHGGTHLEAHTLLRPARVRGRVRVSVRVGVGVRVGVRVSVRVGVRIGVRVRVRARVAVRRALLRPALVSQHYY